ncbi:hypothetical protein [Aeromicrobium sp. JJY06]|uniref:hypothetical protein n=1 Tax=Aeromicrobium sp. JJY06 TaxID=3373478 RepID=UPI00376F2C61
MAVVSAYLAAGAALGWLVNMPYVALGVGWMLAAATAVAAAMSVMSIGARLGFAAVALVTGYLAYVALGPIADEENAYIFIALRMMAVIGVVYAVAFVLAHRGSLARKSGRSELHG